MNSNLIFNLFKLPNDILSVIYLYLDIEHIEILSSIYNYHDFLQHPSFWIEYFRLNKVKIMTYQQNYDKWIIEFKVCNVLSKFNIIGNYRCQYKYKVDKNTTIRCGNDAADKYIRCIKHIRGYHYLRPEKSITILCNPIDESYIKNYIKESNYKLDYEVHQIYHKTYEIPEIILISNNITLCTESVKFTIDLCDNNITHDFLFKLFCDNKIKAIK